MLLEGEDFPARGSVPQDYSRTVWRGQSLAVWAEDRIKDSWKREDFLAVDGVTNPQAIPIGCGQPVTVRTEAQFGLARRTSFEAKGFLASGSIPHHYHSTRAGPGQPPAVGAE